MQKINPEKSFEPTAGYIFLNCRFIGKNCLPEVASCFVISIRIYNFFYCKIYVFLHFFGTVNLYNIWDLGFYMYTPKGYFI